MVMALPFRLSAKGTTSGTRTWPRPSEEAMASGPAYGRRPKGPHSLVADIGPGHFPVQLDLDPLRHGEAALGAGDENGGIRQGDEAMARRLIAATPRR